MMGGDDNTVFVFFLIISYQRISLFVDKALVKGDSNYQSYRYLIKKAKMSQIYNGFVNKDFLGF